MHLAVYHPGPATVEQKHNVKSKTFGVSGERERCEQTALSLVGLCQPSVAVRTIRPLPKITNKIGWMIRKKVHFQQASSKTLFWEYLTSVENEYAVILISGNWAMTGDTKPVLFPAFFKCVISTVASSFRSLYYVDRGRKYNQLFFSPLFLPHCVEHIFTYLPLLPN